MRTIQQIMNTDSNFENNYNNKIFDISKGKIEGENVESWLLKAQNEMKGNGFKLGSINTQQSTNIKRIADYCVAFDHNLKGFDNNNSKGCTGYFTNCVSFNNYINYQIPYIFANWSNNWSFNARKNDQKYMRESLKKPKDIDSVLKKFYSIRDKIIKEVYLNKFPDDINFDNVIDSLDLSSESSYLFIYFFILVILLILLYYFRNKIGRNYYNMDKFKENIEKV